MHIMMRTILSVLLMKIKLIKPHSALMCAQFKLPGLSFLMKIDSLSWNKSGFKDIKAMGLQGTYLKWIKQDFFH